eukprot:1472400-Rhodomonas_salina.5
MLGMRRSAMPMKAQRWLSSLPAFCCFTTTTEGRKGGGGEVESVREYRTWQSLHTRRRCSGTRHSVANGKRRGQRGT